MDNKTFNSAYYMETKSPSYARTLLDCKRVAASNANVLRSGNPEPERMWPPSISTP